MDQVDDRDLTGYPLELLRDRSTAAADEAKRWQSPHDVVVDLRQQGPGISGAQRLQ
jgi:hypothetical protein